MSSAPRRRRRWRSTAAAALTLASVGLVGWLVVSQARTVDWSEVGAALGSYRGATLAAAAALVVLSHAFYAGYDLLGRACTGHAVPARHVAAIGFVSYAFNLNFGAWVGGVGMRYRLYTRHGLAPGVITHVLGLSLATNWLGYLCLAGGLLALGLAPVPADPGPWAGILRAAGAAMLGATAGYLGLCWYARRRPLRVRGVALPLPPPRLAALQLCLSVANWLAIGAILFVLLGGGIPVHQVLAALLAASIAGVITHIPAGLGVIEAVFLALLAPAVPHAVVLAALFAYRGLYYLGPGVLAVLTYAWLEHAARRGRAPAARSR